MLMRPCMYYRLLPGFTRPLSSAYRALKQWKSQQVRERYKELRAEARMRRVSAKSNLETPPVTALELLIPH